MFNICMFVTGPTAGGKTTLVDSLGRRGWVTLHTGDMLRAHNVYASEGESAVAPASADLLVDGWVNDMLVDASFLCVPRMVAMESCPRKIDQLKYCKLASVRGYKPIIVYMYADRDIRLKRMYGRDASFGDERYQVDCRKFAEETDSLPWKFLGVDHASGGPSHNSINVDGIYVPVYGVDTTNKNNSVDDIPWGIVDGISMIMSACTNHYKKLLAGKGKCPGDARMSSMISRCKEELDEVLEAYSKNDPVGVKEELIDSLWFMLVAMSAVGMSPENVVMEFITKYDVNCLRHTTGTKPHSNITT